MKPRVRFAPVEAVSEYVAEVSGQALACRDQGHTWRVYDIDGDSDSGFTRYYRCACKALLEQGLDADGLIVSRRIKYPKGYQMPAGTGRLSREGRGTIRLASAQSDLRAIMMRRQKRAS
ncbi:hypothetical protein ACFYP4_02955 [Streptomyces sp. NPDC005551]|uniref:hypothetical protein n=1 Tax=Streptomyces sp. NPDC005551 TaxID=3364725 RepID=UPI0036B5B8F8